MKKFKTMLAATAAVMALSAVAAPMSAFAAGKTIDQDTNNPQTDTITVSYQNSPTYTVTIPADVTFTDTDNLADKTNNVVVENVFLNKGKAVKVTVASANDYKMLLDGTDSDTYIPYKLTSNQATINEVVTVPSGTKNSPASKTAQLTYSITDKNVPAAGAYSDILTFTIAVVDGTAQTENSTPSKN